MAIPIFGFLRIEKLACLAFVMVGITGLLLSLTGRAREFGAMLPAHPPWFLPEIGQSWLVLQSLLILAGGVGAYGSRSFPLALAGVVASLVFVTPVGVLSFLPGLLMLFLLVLRFRSFFPDRYGFFRPRKVS